MVGLWSPHKADFKASLTAQCLLLGMDEPTDGASTGLFPLRIMTVRLILDTKETNTRHTRKHCIVSEEMA